MAEAHGSGSTTPDIPQRHQVKSVPLMDEIARQLAQQVSEQLPAILQTLQEGGFDPESNILQLECNLTTGNGLRMNNRVPVTALSIGREVTPYSSVATTPQNNATGFRENFPGAVSIADLSLPSSPTWDWRMGGHMSVDNSNSRPQKRREDHARSFNRAGQVIERSSNNQASTTSLIPRDDSPRKKRASDNPALQPSTFDKFVSGVVSKLIGKRVAAPRGCHVEFHPA